MASLLNSSALAGEVDRNTREPQDYIPACLAAKCLVLPHTSRPESPGSCRSLIDRIVKRLPLHLALVKWGLLDVKPQEPDAEQRLSRHTILARIRKIAAGFVEE